MPDEYEIAFKRKSRASLLKRSVPGLASYALIALTMYFAYDLHSVLPVLTGLWVSAVVVVSLARYGLISITGKWIEITSSTWGTLMATGVVLHGLLWGGGFVCALALPELSMISNAMALVCAATTAAAMNTLSGSRWLAQAHIILVLIPAVLYLFWIQDGWPLALLISAYCLYLLAMCKRARNEHIRSFQYEMRLLEQQQELQRINDTDYLTGIYNRGYFDRQVTDAWSLAKRSRLPIAIVILDIDHFKSVNDTYGHPVGDRCLIHVSKVLTKQIKRKTDTLARVGGEEFAVLLQDTDAHGAEVFAERMRQQLLANPMKEPEIKVTASFGVYAKIPELHDEKTILAQGADAAMYKAKEQGRNRVCVHDSGPGNEAGKDDKRA